MADDPVTALMDLATKMLANASGATTTITRPNELKAMGAKDIELDSPPSANVSSKAQ